jgi:hypothetical protein
VISTVNEGALLVSTSYWQTEHASAGLCYLSGNGGAWRLLVPKAAETLLAEMRTGARATIEPSVRSSECWDVVFEDGADTPFSVSIDRRQVDRAMTPGSCRLLVYTERGLQIDLLCEVRP